MVISTMAEYWLTVRIDAQRTMDVRVSGDSCSEVAERCKDVDGCEVIFVRSCEREQEVSE